MDSPNDIREVGNLQIFTNKTKGKGSFGVVYEGSFEGKSVAIKRVLREHFKEIENQFLGLTISHRNLIKYHAIEEADDFVFIVMELCAGTLQDIIKSPHEFPNPGPMESLLFQTVLGLGYLHSKGIIHRDVKPQNFLISVSEDHDRPVIKLADFGLCKQNASNRASFSKSASLLGSLGWAAPESVSGDVKKIQFSADVFSLGCVFGYALTGGSHPFGDEPYSRLLNITTGITDWRKEHLIENYQMKSMIRNMINKEPTSRPSLSKVYELLETFEMKQDRQKLVKDFYERMKLEWQSEMVKELQAFVDDGLCLNFTDDQRRNLLMLVFKGDINGDVNYIERTYALQFKFADILLSKAAIPLFDIYHRDEKGKLAFHYMCRNYRGRDICDKIIFLINAGVDVNTKDNLEKNALLHLISGNSNHEMLQQAIAILAVKGIDVNQVDKNGKNALIYICRNSKEAKYKPHKVVKFLIDKGINVNHVCNDGWNALMYICDKGQDSHTINVIKLLIEKGIDVNLRTESFLSRDSLLILCNNYKGNDLIDILKTLIENGADINSSDDDGSNALLLVSLCYKNTQLPDVLCFLIENGIDVNYVNNEGWNALMLICQNTQEVYANEVMKLLIRKGADINHVKNDGLNALMLICSNWREGDSGKVEQSLIDEKTDINQVSDDDWNSSMHTSKIKQEFNVFTAVKLLIDEGINVNHVCNNGWNALMYICDKGQDSHTINVIKLLIEKGIDVNLRTESFLSRDSLLILCNNYKGNDLIDILKTLIENGADINSSDDDGSNALLLVSLCYKNTQLPDVLCFLIENGIDVNYVNNEGWNALMLICQNTQEVYANEVVILLINKGININHGKNDGLNALMVLCCNWKEPNSLIVANLLIDKGINVNHVSNDGRNALMHISNSKNAAKTHEVVRFLLNEGIDVSRRTSCPVAWDSLLLLCRHYSGDDLLAILQTLVEYGANVNSRTEDGKNALLLVSQHYLHPQLQHVIQFLTEKEIH